MVDIQLVLGLDLNAKKGAVAPSFEHSVQSYETFITLYATETATGRFLSTLISGAAWTWAGALATGT